MGDTKDRDLILNPNEYAYILDATKGLVSCIVGPSKMSLSNTDFLVIFDEGTGKFQKASDIDDAIHTFIVAPENWYVELKNPTVDGSHPMPGTSNMLPTLNIGKKINITGSASFALFPGQMARVIRGHRLHTNQYLKVRVYNAAEANKTLSPVNVTKPENTPTLPDEVQEYLSEKSLMEEPKETSAPAKSYVDGEIIIIKGTECPFYIPQTGFEVIPLGNLLKNGFIRSAVTLENLEYCVKKKENGEQIYIKGPAVVFPEPDENFVKNKDTNDFIFHAYELTDTSGIYVKVLMDYTENGVEHKAGDELFITGKDQQIYYPRKEHAIINYGGREMNHAVAIPEGEGRYVLNRKTGSVTTIMGPKMFLPNPIDEVIVRRVLTREECSLWFPNSTKALEANGHLDQSECGLDEYDANRLHSNSLRKSSGGASFSRGTTYTEPRTIQIDNKYKGVVGIDVYTGYAINVISKTGSRQVVVGPAFYPLAYDETLETLEVSTGKPKTTDTLKKFVYLRTDNNKISDIIELQTKDFVDMEVKLSFCVDFLPEYKDKWFSVENYVKYLTDRVRSILKNTAKTYDADEFYANVTPIIQNTILRKNVGHTEDDSEKTRERGMLFSENGMFVKDIEILKVTVEDNYIGRNFMDYQEKAVTCSLELLSKRKDATKVVEVNKLESTIKESYAALEKVKEELEAAASKRNAQIELELTKLREARVTYLVEQEESRIDARTALNAYDVQRRHADDEENLFVMEEKAILEARVFKEHGDVITQILGAVSPELIASMTSASNNELACQIMKAISPYAISTGESVVDTVTRLTKGTPVEAIVDRIMHPIAKTARAATKTVHLQSNDRDFDDPDEYI